MAEFTSELQLSATPRNNHTLTGIQRKIPSNDTNCDTNENEQKEISNGHAIDAVLAKKLPPDFKPEQKEISNGHAIDAVLAKKLPPDFKPGLNSPRRKTLSPLKASPRTGSYMPLSRDSSPVRQSQIWNQWLVENPSECIQEYNIKQMEGLYGKHLGGRVDSALHWYRERAVTAASAPVSFTPRSTQTETPSGSPDSKHFMGIPYRNREMKARDMLKSERSLNKLSTRHRVPTTPTVHDIRAREQKFKNDAVVAERRRTRFKDIIPTYDASSDRHCKAYFKRNDVQRLISVTCSRE